MPVKRLGRAFLQNLPYCLPLSIYSAILGWIMSGLAITPLNSYLPLWDMSLGFFAFAILLLGASVVAILSFLKESHKVAAHSDCVITNNNDGESAEGPG